VDATNSLRVETDATSLANALATGAAAQFAAKLPAEAGHGAAQSVVDVAQAESLWAPSIAAGAAIRADTLAAGSSLAAHATAVAKQNEQALSDTVATNEQNAKDLTPHPVVET
jgi:cell division septation protein DedD